MTIYAECVGANASTRVVVSRLAGSTCDLSLDDAAGAIDSQFDLWIGALGPIAAAIETRDAGHLTARFLVSLDERILRHFEANCFN